MQRDNEKAERARKKLGLTPVGGSDAHNAADVGAYATWLPERVTTVRELVAALKNGNCHAVVRNRTGEFTPLADTP